MGVGVMRGMQEIVLVCVEKIKPALLQAFN